MSLVLRSRLPVLLVATVALIGATWMGSANEVGAEGGAVPAGATTVSAFPWVYDYEIAKRRAKAENKDIFMHFTGSDWCHYCQQMDKNVFADKSFRQAALQRYVFLYLDFPQNDAVAKRRVVNAALNEKLAKEYLVEGFPTMVLTAANGSPYGYMNYQGEPAALFLRNLAGVHTGGRAIQRLFRERDKASIATLKAGVPALWKSGFFEYPPYAWVQHVIRKNDPQNKHGLLAHVLSLDESRAIGELTYRQDWVKLDAALLASKHLNDGQLFEPAFKLALQYKKVGKVAGARAWLARMQARPGIRGDKSAQFAIKKLTAELNAIGAATPAMGR